MPCKGYKKARITNEPNIESKLRANVAARYKILTSLGYG